MQINGGCNAIDTAFNPSLDQFLKKERNSIHNKTHNTCWLLTVPIKKKTSQ